ncbi:MAG TPA: amino acid adenylation domain-containing protein, partial [Pyrinomonadaceae bacterium]
SYAALDHSTVLLHMAPPAFDASTFEVWGALLRGGRCAVVTERVPTAETLEAAIRRHRATTAWLTASLFNAVVEERASALAGLRQLLAGGEALSAAHIRRALSEAGGLEVVNGYGPTECTTFACCHAVREAPRVGARSVPIGRPIQATRGYVCGARMELQPAAARGELYLGGAGLARGYLNRPGLTAERFVPDPFSGERGGRLYRTGDVVRRVSGGGGELEYVGRVDTQVKVRGHRIEPGEVEAALREQEEVAECAVVVVESEGGDKRLVAYVVAEGGEAAAGLAERLRSYLAGRLPAYMVPSAFVLLDALPLTPNGKLDRRALPAPEWGAAAAVAEYIGPRDAYEEVVAGTFSEVLRVERVGVTDDFFALGGHSLLATQVVARLRRAFGVEVALRSLFEQPTPRGLGGEVRRLLTEGGQTQAATLRPRQADAAGGTEQGAAESGAVPDSAEPVLSVAPASFGQQRLWFLDQLEPGARAYNVPMAVRLGGALRAAALGQALTEVVRRHEALRTTFAADEAGPVQLVGRPTPVALPLVDLSALPEAAARAAAARLAAAEAARAFDLANGPLLRATLLRLTSEEHVLLFTMHHIVSDGWSMGVLGREMVALYGAFSRGAASPLAELPIQYGDYARWQRGWLQGEVLERQLSYWRGQLVGAPPMLELPTDRPRPRVQTGRGAEIGLTLGEALSRRLRGLSQERGATLFMTLLAAWQALLWRWSGQEDVVVGTPIAGRGQVETEGLIGLFINTLALRARVDARAGFDALLGQVREVTLGAYTHQDLPFERVVEELEPGRGLSHTPLFQVMFTLHNEPEGALSGEGDGLAAEMWQAPVASVKFDLTLSLHETEEGIDGALGYSTDLFDEATIRRMIEHFRRLLEAVTREPGRALYELELMTPEERERLVVGWNRTRVEHPPCRGVHELFERQAALRPDAVAVVCEGAQLTYAELNARANRLARRLRSLGAGPESLIGIYLGRAPELLVAALATLKAGAAYLPLSTSLPPARLSLLLAESKPAALLTFSSLAAELPETPAPVLRLDEEPETPSRDAARNLGVEVAPEAMAYVIYTSGSTGRPKGVVVEHRQIVNYLLGIARRLGMAPGHSYALAQPHSVDASKTFLLGAPCTGGVLHLVGEEAATDPAALAGYVAGRRVQYLKLAPSHLAALERGLGGVGGLVPRRWLMLGGEAAGGRWAVRVADEARGRGCRVLNHYGPTEATVAALTYGVGGGDTGGPRGDADGGGEAAGSGGGVGVTLPVGRPLPNVTAYVLDAWGQVVPAGMVGELYLGGAGVARGYAGHAAATAERFTPDPFSRVPGARLYATGDLVRHLPDWEVEYLRRADAQVKVRGFRVEPGEVEAALLEHPSVKEAAVIAREDPAGRTHLVAYVSADGGQSSADGQTVAAAELRGHLAERLPHYMVPSAFVFLNALPRTPHGKLDRRALPAPEWG